jgi:hypothetical protein
MENRYRLVAYRDGRVITLRHYDTVLAMRSQLKEIIKSSDFVKLMDMKRGCTIEKLEGDLVALRRKQEEEAARGVKKR